MTILWVSADAYAVAYAECFLARFGISVTGASAVADILGQLSILERADVIVIDVASGSTAEADCESIGSLVPKVPIVVVAQQDTLSTSAVVDSLYFERRPLLGPRLVAALQVALAHDIYLRTTPRRQLSWVERALRVLETSFRDPFLSAAKVASELHVAAGYLGRLMTKHLGHGVMAHAHQLRVAESRRLLQTTDLSIKEVAAACGYMTTKALDLHFARLCRCTPSAYRARSAKAARLCHTLADIG